MRHIWTALATAALLIIHPAAHAADETPAERAAKAARLKKAMQRLDREPTVQEVMRKAVSYYKVQPEILKRLRRASNLRAVLPTLSTRYGYGMDRRERSLRDPLVPLQSDEQWNTGAHGASATLTWDLPTLVFNPAELQTYALTGIRINVLKEVSRIYFIRRQVLLQLLVKPPADPLARVALEQRVLEFTALIDSFTGSYFSREIEQRGMK